MGGELVGDATTIGEGVVAGRDRPSRFGPAHLVIFLLTWGAFAALTFQAVRPRPGNSSESTEWAVVTTLASLSGPLTGGIARHFQSCCVAASMSILPWALPFPVAGFWAQVAIAPRRGPANLLRLMAWGLGWLGWFGGGVLSFFHALG